MRTVWMAAVGSLGLICAAGAAGRSAQFTVTAVQSSPQGQVTMTSKVWVTESQARADLKHPLGGDMMVLLTDGAVYQLSPKDKQGIKGKLPPEIKPGQDNFDRFIRSLAFNGSEVVKSAKKVGTGTVAGFPCDIYRQSETKQGSTRSIQVWMPQKMNPRFALKAIIETSVKKPGVSMKETLNVTLSNVKVNAPIPASVFAVPKGYKITEGKVQAPGKPGGP
jgi:outer membrane lipoprotein-sorting protein